MFIRPYERFTVGGVNTIRGFDSGAIDEEELTGFNRGGRARFYGGAELAVDSQLFDTQKVYLVPFADFGAVGSDLRTFGSVRASWGLGVAVGLAAGGRSSFPTPARCAQSPATTFRGFNLM